MLQRLERLLRLFATTWASKANVRRSGEAASQRRLGPTCVAAAKRLCPPNLAAPLEKRRAPWPLAGPPNLETASGHYELFSGQ